LDGIRPSHFSEIERWAFKSTAVHFREDAESSFYKMKQKEENSLDSKEWNEKVFSALFPLAE
jgi:hypothetical protein